MNIARFRRFSLVVVFIICTFSLGYTQETSDFREDFSRGLKANGWQTKGPGEVIEEESQFYGKCIKIQSKSRRGETYLIKKFKAKKGTFLFKAMFKSEGVVTGKKSYEQAKFQAVLYDARGNNLSKKENYWPGSDFHETFGWSPREFEVVELKGNEIVELKIGFQNAKGIIYVDEIEVFHTPE